MKIEIYYGTNSSGTFEATQTMQATLEKAGHTVTVQSARDADAAKVGQADLTILGSCTWERFVDDKRLEGQLQQHMRILAEELQTRTLTGKKFAVFALGDSSYTNFANAATHLEALVKKIGATPVGNTLRIDGWFFNLEQNRKKAGDWAKTIISSLS